MTVTTLRVVNMPQAVGSSVAPTSAPYVMGSIADVSGIANIVGFTVASFEDYSINWTDFSFDYLAEE